MFSSPEWFSVYLGKLACDVSSANVRQQVVKSVTHVLDCPDAIDFLKQCLGKLAPSFDDINVKVAFYF